MPVSPLARVTVEAKFAALGLEVETMIQAVK